MRRFFAPPAQWAGEEVVLDREETHHLARVLRLGPGAWVVVADGRGRAAAAVVQGVNPEGAILHLQDEVTAPAESPLEVVLGVGLAKAEAMDQVVRQATEMGVRRLLPFTSAYADKRPADRAPRRSDRWRRQAQESLKSCQRLWLPEIAPIQPFADVLNGPEEVKLLCYEGERPGQRWSFPGAPLPGAVRVLVGPEGGFSPAEVAQAREAGFRVISLGPRRLRVETAALTVVALVQFAWGDLR